MKKLFLVISFVSLSSLAAEEFVQDKLNISQYQRPAEKITNRLYALNVSGNGVYSETKSYYETVSQNNSNNTYIDNSQVLSNNSFTLFGISGRDYSSYLGYEPILYLSMYITGTIDGVVQGVAGGQLGIYENVYLLAEYGVYSRPENVDMDDGVASSGNFINYGLSLHIQTGRQGLITLEGIYRDMLKEEYEEGEDYSSVNKKYDHSQWFLMVNTVFFLSGKHTGLEAGVGVGENIFTFKVGLKFRYF